MVCAYTLPLSLHAKIITTPPRSQLAGCTSVKEGYSWFDAGCLKDDCLVHKWYTFAKYFRGIWQMLVFY
jgi:hypothetical protein